jgi:hypothetical protein
VRSVTEADRFWAKVNKDGPVHPVLGTRCWLWTGAKNPDGYGNFRVGGKVVKAHRIAWKIQTGEWPDAHTLHRCDQPSCIRFEHLFEGSHAANMQDAATKGRFSRRGEANPRAILTTAAVAAIRAAKPAHYARNRALVETLAETYGTTPAYIRLLWRKNNLWS